MSNNKREHSSVVLTASSLILDIEGTTTSISFVKDVLFPYVRKHLEAYINGNWNSTSLQDTVKALKTQAKDDEENKVEGVITIPESGEKDVVAKSIIENVNWQMDNDRKTKSLKDLQGLIMEEGYTKGDLKGHVYDDVEPNLKSWTEQGKSIYIYSSGSVHAQKLLFGHSEKGDLLPFIKGHYDTSVGMKGDEGSYKKILEELSIPPSEAAFLTDIPKEARAAKSAGLFAVLVSREGNAPLVDEDKAEFSVITSFADIDFENNNKKRKICTENNVNSENKPVKSCEVSVEQVNKPNDPLTINSDVEMMEVDENTDADKGKTSQKEELDKLQQKDVSDKASSELNSENVKSTSNEEVCVKQTEEPNKINCENESSDASIVNGVAKSNDKTELKTADTKELVKKCAASAEKIMIIVTNTDNVESDKSEIEVKSEKTVCLENKPLEIPSDGPSNSEIPSDKAQNPLPVTETEKISEGSNEIEKTDEDKKENPVRVANDAKASEETVKESQVENSRSDDSKIESKVNDEDKPTEVSKEKLDDDVSAGKALPETKKETEVVAEEKSEPVVSECKETIKSVSESETKQPSQDLKEKTLGEEEKSKTAEEEVSKNIVADTEKINTDSQSGDKSETTSHTVKINELTEDKVKPSEEEIKKDIVADEKMDTESKGVDKTETTSQSVESKELTEDNVVKPSEEETKKDIVADEKMDTESKDADKTESTSQTVESNELTEDKSKTSEGEIKKDIVAGEKMDTDGKGVDKTETTSQTVKSKELTEDKVVKPSEEEKNKDIVADEKMDTESKGADKTETTSQTVESKELSKDKVKPSEEETKKDIVEKMDTESSADKNETKVPSNDKADVNGKLNGVEEKMANGNLTNGNSSEEKSGIANGSSSPETNKEADAEITKEKVIEAKKCDVTENTATETVVEA